MGFKGRFGLSDLPYNLKNEIKNNMKRKLVLKRKRFTTSDLIKKNNIMHQKILRTAIGTNGEVLKIVSTERSKPFTLKEAVQSRIILVSKETVLKFFTEQEIKTLKLNYYE